MSDTADNPRRMSAWLALCIICVPAIFCWLVLRSGYSRSLRGAVFVYAIILTGVGFIGRIP